MVDRDAGHNDDRSGSQAVYLSG